MILLPNMYNAFGPSSTVRAHYTAVRSSSFEFALRGIAEWRRSMDGGDDAGSSSSTGNSNSHDSTSATRTVLLLPFAVEEALLIPGQSQTLVLKEGRFFDLLEEAMDEHASVIGTLLMGGESHLGVLPLCEITSYQMEAGYRGKVTAQVTLQCVARAQLVELNQLRPVMRGICTELQDDDHDIMASSTSTDSSTNDTSSKEMVEELVEDIESMIELASSSSDTTRTGTGTTDTLDDPQTMYEQTFWMALTTLGYTPASSSQLMGDDDDDDGDPAWPDSSAQELHAMSWAAISTVADPTLRYQAFATTSVLERLRVVRRALLQQSLPVSTKTQDVSSIRHDRDDDSSDDGPSSSSSFFGDSGFE
ncbi:ATP-dependent protease La (LON) domain [Seminavis robusta]|uniref:ATP-dependent protease La (LON) domain n=1 Tax=Seminavis robusta TaxID=568900 RepID=A0A9N8H3U2_9STRA|nr:ATP-dependent protease La (LON) domain [Seminavis robusta]|eukprot:Sro46_g027440.1 ATP-dependent protease La (LON) domain (363) ;mRNA; f:69199-70287